MQQRGGKGSMGWGAAIGVDKRQNQEGIKHREKCVLIAIAAAMTRSRQEQLQLKDATSYATEFDEMVQDSIVTVAERM